MSSRYDRRGVSASKSEVHTAIKGLDKGLYPNAFCKILADFVGNDEEFCNLMHADTAGTKTSLAYMYWKETGDLDVWKGIVEDAIVMNLDDMACVGCTNDIILSSTIGRNKNLIPGEVITTIIQHANSFIHKMAAHGIRIHSAGGETADVGDIVRTIDVGYTAFARMKKEDVIDIHLKPGNYIVGLGSYGQTSYEDFYNGGMGSNGLTSARHDVFHKLYKAKYQDAYDHNTPQDVIFVGSKKLTDTIDIHGSKIPIGKLVLSPTRTFLPLLKDIVSQHKSSIDGMIHNTGGAHTKVLKFVHQPLHIIKDNLLPIPPLFNLIQAESNTDWQEMYEVFNMGTRLEIYTSEIKVVNDILEKAEGLGIPAQIIGKVESGASPQVKLTHKDEIFTYLPS